MPLWLFQTAVALDGGFGSDPALAGGDQTEQILLSFIKLLFLLAFGIYVLFSFVATRQISIMRKTVITTFSNVVTILGYVHLTLSILVLVLSYFLL